MTTYNNLLVAGSSVTAGTSDKTMALTDPQVWPHFLLSALRSNIFCNLAMPAGGNISIAKNLIYTLETKPEYTPADTLVVFNLAPLDRFDVMCAVDHPNANQHFSWAKDFGFNWITSGSFTAKTPPFNGILEKNMGYDAIVNFNALELIGLITYLEDRGYHFHFILDNCSILTDAPTYLTDFLQAKKRHWVNFDNHLALREYCQSHNSMIDNEHPTVAGHQLVSQQLEQHLYQEIQ
jgi:hypothetical protein